MTADRAVIYAAKSTEDRHGSIPDQVADCKALAERNGWTVLKVFSDEGYSGYSGNRGPGLSAATRKAEDNAPCALIVQHSDRLARGDGKQAIHLVEHALWAMRHDVTIASVQDSQTFGDLLYAVVTGQRNHEDSKRKSASVKGGMKRRAERGKANGGPPAYGYRWQGPKGEQELQPYEPEAAIVRRIFAEYVAGRSQQAITRGLVADGLKTQRDRAWYQGTVAKVLANPVYVGRLRLNGDAYEGTHPPLVDEELFRQATQLRSATARTKGKGRGRPSAGTHLFTKGHLRCGSCGDAMVPRTVQNRTPGAPPSETYECLGRRRFGAESCPQKPIRRVIVDRAVTDYFEQAAFDREATAEQVKAVAAQRVVDIRTLREEAERELTTAGERLARIKRAMQDGYLDAEDYAEQRAELLAEQDAANANVERLREQERQRELNAQLDVGLESLEALRAIREAIIMGVRDAPNVEAVRAALLRLFEGFTLHRYTPTQEAGVWIAPYDHDVQYEVLEGLGKDGCQWIAPHVRPEYVAGFGPRGKTAKPARIPLPLGVINEANGLTT